MGSRWCTSHQLQLPRCYLSIAAEKCVTRSYRPVLHCRCTFGEISHLGCNWSNTSYWSCWMGRANNPLETVARNQLVRPSNLKFQCFHKYFSQLGQSKNEDKHAGCSRRPTRGASSKSFWCNNTQPTVLGTCRLMRKKEKFSIKVVPSRRNLSKTSFKRIKMKLVQLSACSQEL